MKCTSTLARVLASLGFFASGVADAQVYHTWPDSSGACSGSLQACIDAAAPGDSIAIGEDDAPGDGYTAIDESIAIGKSLTLTAAAGVDAVFAPGRFITVSSPATGAVTVELDRLTLQHGHVRVTHNSDTESYYRLSRLHLDGTDVAPGSCAVEFLNAAAGTANFSLGDSDVRVRDAAPANILCTSGDGTRNASYFRNRVLAEGAHRVLSVGGGAAGTVSILNNTITGSGYISGIIVSQAAGSPPNSIDVLSNTVMGQAGGGTESAIEVGISQSTARIGNNTIVHNRSGILVSRFDTSPSSVRVANNVLAFNTTAGFTIYDEASDWISNDYNLVHGNGFDFFTPGPNTVTADPMLKSRWNPRPSSIASPLVDRGSNADVPVTIFGPGFDADGEPRIVASTVDIGAYEVQLDIAGWHRSTDANTPGGDYTNIDEPIWSLFDTDSLFVTPVNAPGASAESAYNLGVFVNNESPSHWSIYHENLAPMSTGRAFSVLRPLEGRSHFVHTTASSNVFGQYTRLDHPELDGHPSAYAFVSHLWNPGGVGGTYHDHRFALEYTGGHWQIRNEDAADMPLGVSFNVTIAPTITPNAFAAYVGPAPRSELKLEHPLLDEHPCAAPQVTRMDNPFDALITSDDVPYALAYRTGAIGAPGHWYLYALGGGGSAFVANAAFNVMVHGAQANGCLDDDRIFADGFEG